MVNGKANAKTKKPKKSVTVATPSDAVKKQKTKAPRAARKLIEPVGDREARVVGAPSKNRSISRPVALGVITAFLLIVVTVFGLGFKSINSGNSEKSASTGKTTGPTSPKTRQPTNELPFAKPKTMDTGPKDLVFTVKNGDTMSGLISDYINQMHTQHQEISLARLGYAQDYLMQHYGYKPLAANEKNFTVSAKDVLAAWSVAANADARAAFWSDYAARAGVR